jgi:hypothetical protein
LALLVLAPSAGAVILRNEGRTFMYEPGPSSPAPARSFATPRTKGSGKGNGKGGGAADVVYHEGPVMPANTNYTLFWSPSGPSAYPAGYEEGIDGFFEDLAHDSGLQSNSDSILAQYTDSSGHSAAYDSHFGEALNDTDPYPTSGGCTAAKTCLTDAQIRAELVAYVQAHGLPVGLEHEYFVLTPEGVEDCKEQASEVCSYGTKTHNYCAYHSFIEVSGTYLVYAVNPLIPACDIAKWPNENVSDAVIAGGLLHEHSESLTDPLGNAWHTNGAGEEEVADKCRTFKAKGKKSEFGAPLGEAPDKAPYNEVIDGHIYLYQQIWSNSAGSCRQRVAELPTVTSVSPKTGPASGGNTVTVTGTGFSSPTSVKFGKNTATEVHVESSTRLTAVVPAGEGKAKLTAITSLGQGPESKVAYKYK